MKKYIHLDEYGSHIYSAETPTMITLRPSKYGNWAETYKGKVIARIQDDGNGARIQLENKTLGYLDYSQLENLVLLLDRYRANSELMGKFKKARLK